MSDVVVLTDDVVERAVEAMQTMISGEHEAETRYAMACALVDCVVDALREGSREEVLEDAVSHQAGRQDRAGVDLSQAG